VAVASAGPLCKIIICTSLQTDNHASTSSLIFTGRTPHKQCQSSEGNKKL